MNYHSRKTKLQKKIIVWLLLGVFTADQFAFAAAAIMPDNQAPVDQRPLVLETANGLPLVNVTAPTAGGVSRNQYTDFNVLVNGAILNNSYLLTNTQLAGFVQGNANLAKGTAQIIVNEVTSGKPTNMQGFLEVAGDRASVVIANPNGISVNGGGFINTASAVLTTGRPEYTVNGSLEGFRVIEGAVNISGEGLEGNTADSVSILSRAAKINAGIWAETIHVRTGANNISYADMQATAIENAGNIPQVALDVAAVGGMYANRITIIGTEKGLGVNLAGTLAATEAAELNVNGEIKVTGTLYSQGTTRVEAEGLVNNKTVAAGRDLTIQVEKEIVNSGVLGAGISEAGEVTQNGTLMLDAKNIINDTAQIISGADLNINAVNVTNKEGEISAQRDSKLEVEETLNLRGGKVTAQNDLTINAKSVPLDGIIAAGKDLSITVKTDLTNQEAGTDFGITKAGGNMLLATEGSVINNKKLEAGSKLTIEAAKLQQIDGAEINAKDILLKVKDIDNIGVINADQKAEIEAKTLVNRGAGRIYGDAIFITADLVQNIKDTALEAELKTGIDKLNAKAAELDAAFAVDVTGFTNQGQINDYRTEIENKTASYTAQKDIVEDVLTRLGAVSAGTLAARKELTVQSNTLLNSVNALIYSGGDMTLSATDKLTNNGASIEAQGDLTINTAQLEDLNAAFSAQRIAGEVVNNPNKIRIDQNGHGEKGQSFDESEFSKLNSGYGAYHNQKLNIKEPIDLAEYSIVEQISAEDIADGETPFPDEWIGKSMPNYDYDDPIFTEFGVVSMTTPRPDYSDATAQAAWDADYKVILAQLNLKITDYNAEVNAHNTALGLEAGREIHNYTIIRTNTQTSNLEVQTSKAGKIVSGGNLNINGDVLNENSRMLAGKVLTVNGNVNNVALENQEKSVTFGTTQASYTKKRSWPHKSRKRRYKSEVFMTPQVELGNTTTLGVAEYIDESGEKPDETDITQNARDNVAKSLDPFSLDSASGNTPNSWLEAADLLTSSLYTLNPDVTAKYLIETDSRFTNKKEFLSSDYMYEQMLWDPERVPKRLGDGFYEQGLIREQIMNQTGQRYLDGYTNDETSFKALMDAGVTFAKAYDLVPGIALTKEQVAALTSDIIWLETKTVMVDGAPVEVVYPRVYLRQSSQMTLDSSGSLLSGKELIVNAKEAVTNSGTLLGKKVVINAGEINNSGRVAGENVELKSERDLNSTGLIYGEDKVSLSAGEDINVKSKVQQLANQTVLDTTAGIAVKGEEGILLISAGNNVNLEGATLQALGEQGSIILEAGKDVNLTTNKLSAQKDMTLNQDNYLRTNRSTELGTSVQAKGDIKVKAGESVSARAAYLASEDGKIELEAGKDITLEEGYSEASDDYGIKYKESGFLSSKKTTIKDSDSSREAMGTVVSGEEVSLKAGTDFTVKAGTVVANNDVNIEAGGDINVLSAENEYSSGYLKDVKKSGLFGSGIGFTIGTEKRKDIYTSTAVEQAGSTIGSLAGNVAMKAGEDVTIKASDIIVGKDIEISGANVDITKGENIYVNTEEHEFKRSGLSVGLGGEAVDAAVSAEGHLERAGKVEDKRLATLHAYKAYDDIKDNYDKIKKAVKDPSKALELKVSIGSQKSKSESDSTTVQTAGSKVMAQGDVNITARESDLNVKGSTVSGENVTLKAKEDINITSGENTNVTNEDSKSSGWSAGVTLGASGITGINASVNKGKENIDENSKGYTQSVINASEELRLESGEDTNIKGGKVIGDKVTADVGGNLNIESEQDEHYYDSKSSNNGFGVSLDFGYKLDMMNETVNKVVKGGGITGGVTKGKIDSDYKSVTEQSGIYAGKKGFDLNVDGNTELKGAVIVSEAESEKNKISTGTLTYEDIENEAKYKAETDKTGFETTNGKLNIKNVIVGEISSAAAGSEGQASSTTKAAVSEGTIEIRSDEGKEEKTDLSGLSRDSDDSLNKLSPIFDRDKILEKQEASALFSEIAFDSIGSLAVRKRDKMLALAGKAEAPELREFYLKEAAKWEDGGEYKLILHGLGGALASEIGGGKFGEGISVGVVNEMVISVLLKNAKTLGLSEQDIKLISNKLGQAIGGHSGGAIAESATTHNAMQHLNIVQDILKHVIKEGMLDSLEENQLLSFQVKIKGVSGIIFIDRDGQYFEGSGIDSDIFIKTLIPGISAGIVEVPINTNDSSKDRYLAITGTSLSGSAGMYSIVKGYDIYFNQDDSISLINNESLGISTSPFPSVGINSSYYIGNIYEPGFFIRGYDQRSYINNFINNNDMRQYDTYYKIVKDDYTGSIFKEHLIIRTNPRTGGRETLSFIDGKEHWEAKAMQKDEPIKYGWYK
ncbi:MAG TPA: hemagglutinin repeat-containing protein [Candidatus Avacidaminococcus intestinavium]|uniref:Hemagglutinin repeat-containing protein n=1 Tax=Candidatus Avacidaminococcus intestinavium TaxID=2840684 RepID=A0A9D1MPW1_9FIRM|nr:hemagglutinin repeat-containing protein [Candidatus Avacidaminococcus intestinavium]